MFSGGGQNAIYKILELLAEDLRFVEICGKGLLFVGIDLDYSYICPFDTKPQSIFLKSQQASAVHVYLVVGLG